MQTVKDILVSIGYSPRDAGKGWHCRPLYRDSDSNTALCVDKENGLWYDFKENVGGNLEKLVALTLQKSEDEVKKYFLEKSFDFDDITYEEQENVADFEHRVYPSEWLSKLQKEHSYWEGRGVSKETVELFRGGVATNGRMMNRYVFPVFNPQNKIIGFNGRDLIKESKRAKWKIMGSKKNFLYPLFLNEKNLFEQKEVILIESIGDMLSLWENDIKNTIVLFGLVVFPPVIKKLLEVRPKRIVIATNNDGGAFSAGNRAAAKIRKQLETYFDSDIIVTHLPPEEKNDFGKMNSEDILLWKRQLKNYQPQE
jgi:DNA primase